MVPVAAVERGKATEVAARSVRPETQGQERVAVPRVGRPARATSACVVHPAVVPCGLPSVMEGPHLAAICVIRGDVAEKVVAAQAVWDRVRLAGVRHDVAGADQVPDAA